MQNIKYLILLMVCLFVTSCVTAQSDVDSLHQQVRALERQQQRDRQNMTQRLEEYQVLLQEIDQGLSQAGGSVQATQANLWAEVESMRVQLATVTGSLDSLERRYNETREEHLDSRQTLRELRAKTTELDQSVKMISSQLGIEISSGSEGPDMSEGPDKPAETPQVEDSQPAPTTPTSARALYQRALDYFFDRDYEQAQSLWQEFAENFTDHDLASNAYFWQGESFYQMQKYAQAVLAYQEVITNFPDSNKMSASMLKQGMSFFHLDREEAGELVLNELLSKFPDTAEARRAKAFISQQ